MSRLKDRVAIVTGSARGIGKGIAVGSAEAGAHVVVAEIDPDTGKTTANEIRALGRKSLAITTDVRNSKQVAKLIETTVKEFGRIDILVNNAGGIIPLSPLVALKEKDWDWIMDIDLKMIGGSALTDMSWACLILENPEGKWGGVWAPARSPASFFRKA